MRGSYTILFSIFLFFVSCNNDTEYHLYLNQINEIEEQTQILEENSLRYFSYIENYMNSFNFRTVRKIKPWYEKDLNTINASDSLVKFINSIDANLISRNINEENLNQSVFVENRDIKQLHLSINTFLKSIDKNTNNIYRSEKIVEAIKRNLDIDSIPLEAGKYKKYKLHALLLFVRNNVLAAKSDLLAMVASQVDGHHGQGNYYWFETLVIPEKRKIRIGETYKAEIKLCAGIDTFHNFPFFIEGRPLTDRRQGYHFYKEKVTDKVGKVSKNGYMLVANPVTEDTTKYPFKIEYEIVE